MKTAWELDDGGENENDYDDNDNPDGDNGYEYDDNIHQMPYSMPAMPRMSVDNIPGRFHIAEAAFTDLSISDDCIRTVILMDSTSFQIKRLIEDINSSEQYAQAGSEYPLLFYAVLPDSQSACDTANAWLLYLQCAYPQCDGKLIRELFHAGLKEYVRTFLRYQCPSHLPLWFVAYTANKPL